VACSLAAVGGVGGSAATSSLEAITGSSSGSDGLNPKYTYIKWEGDMKCCEIL